MLPRATSCIPMEKTLLLLVLGPRRTSTTFWIHNFDNIGAQWNVLYDQSTVMLQVVCSSLLENILGLFLFKTCLTVVVTVLVLCHRRGGSKCLQQKLHAFSLSSLVCSTAPFPPIIKAYDLPYNFYFCCPLLSNTEVTCTVTNEGTGGDSSRSQMSNSESEQQAPTPGTVSFF